MSKRQNETIISSAKERDHFGDQRLPHAACHFLKKVQLPDKEIIFIEATFSNTLKELSLCLTLGNYAI